MAAPKPSAEQFVPKNATLPTLKAAASGCTACPIHQLGGATVFGVGDGHSPLMLVGEQPGDQEDKQGLPFVGPSGRLLDQALESAGIVRSAAYVTNVVKHFKWEPRGKRRIHSKPSASEIQACKPWLEHEIELIKPKVVVALGSTAAMALFGKDFRVTKSRGEPVPTKLAPHGLATIHPSAILREVDENLRNIQMESFIKDLSVAARLLAVM